MKLYEFSGLFSCSAFNVSLSIPVARNWSDFIWVLVISYDFPIVSDVFMIFLWFPLKFMDLNSRSVFNAVSLLDFSAFWIYHVIPYALLRFYEIFLKFMDCFQQLVWIRFLHGNYAVPWFTAARSWKCLGVLSVSSGISGASSWLSKFSLDILEQLMELPRSS